MIDLTIKSPDRIIDKFMRYDLDRSELVPRGGTYFVAIHVDNEVMMRSAIAEYSQRPALDTWYAYRCVECNKRPSWFPEAHAGLCIICHAFSTEVRQHNMRTPIIVDEDGTSHVEKLERQIKWQQQLIDKLIDMAIPPF